MNVDKSLIVIENKSISRVLEVSEGLVSTKSYVRGTDKLISESGGTEARVIVNSISYSTGDGTLRYAGSAQSDPEAGFSRHKVLLKPHDGACFSVTLLYETFMDEPILRKSVYVSNTGSAAIMLDGVTVEEISLETGGKSVLILENDYVRAGMTDPDGCTRSPWVEHIREYANTVLSPKGGLHTFSYPHALHVRLIPGASYQSFSVYEFAVPNADEAERGEGFRRATRALMPWSRERWLPCEIAPTNDLTLLYKGIDTAAEAGYETVLLFHGWIDGELISPLFETYADYVPRKALFPNGWEDVRKLVDYAHGKGLKVGFYAIYVSIWDDVKSRAVADNRWQLEFAPDDDSQRWGTTLCPASDWGPYVNRKILEAVELGGFDGIALDGPYYGDVCMAGNHAHEPGGSSQPLAWQRQIELYEALKARGKFSFAAQGFCAFFHGLCRVGQTGYDEGDFGDKGIWEQILNTRRGAYEYTKVFRPEQGVFFIPGASWLSGPCLEPYEENLKEYDAYLANCFGYGFDGACFQTVAYDGPQSLALIRKWTDFWKKHEDYFRRGLIRHIVKPDGRSPDAIIHVIEDEKRGLLVMYNPSDEEAGAVFSLPFACSAVPSAEDSSSARVSGRKAEARIGARGCVHLEIQIEE